MSSDEIVIKIVIINILLEGSIVSGPKARNLSSGNQTAVRPSRLYYIFYCIYLYYCIAGFKTVVFTLSFDLLFSQYFYT